MNVISPRRSRLQAGNVKAGQRECGEKQRESSIIVMLADFKQLLDVFRQHHVSLDLFRLKLGLFLYRQEGFGAIGRNNFFEFC